VSKELLQVQATMLLCSMASCLSTSHLMAAIDSLVLLSRARVTHISLRTQWRAQRPTLS
jgi:hypothetical protein